MYENYLGTLSVTKKLCWCCQYSDYNIGWTALILDFFEGQNNFFFPPQNIQLYSVGAPSLLFNESQLLIFSNSFTRL
jgi:hypothetical protein